ncbi:DUF6402 family protein [Pectobacterium parmentieri]|uniref:DUF6402 family protein n=1 Tax=Pectobacterium parmentieri TaxID=1905730 RepID=UPI000CDDF25C|nr:DUF6402 family protein [Pectobacterium parmentieri]AYH04039.1 hypothetical protein C5E25_00720 [Pectobacterium parmentieri]AYH12860.1 hypothetical protein C5E23_00705 [Pectobacterium parmentieri]AYH21563.1 hypothetical protein C5E21_00705 [Pectobacterium parmentieri]MBN3179738.1 hypothetical protein [Pectobacterium parmentieri]POW23660.1 hypothetical protein PB20LOC_04348 [Pectobacterium parmentieri]
MVVATSKTSPTSNAEGKKIDVDVFHIDQIPDAMDKMGWKIAPQLMRHWFSLSPADKWTTDRKNSLLNTDARTLKTSEYNDSIVKMDWALRYSQVYEKYEYLIKNWNTQKGIELLKYRLKSLGYVPGESIKLGYNDSAIVLDASAQVNIIQVGSTMDTINDWYGAIGKANLKVAVRGYTSVYERKPIFVFGAIGTFIKDTYDFVDKKIMNSIDIEKPEPLGVWGKDYILTKAETAIYLSSYSAGLFGFLAREYFGFVPVWNSDFRKWQDKHNSGSDFIVFSDVFWTLPSENKRMIFL